ncbi:hypothetical protein C8J56DRAFT_960191 [Mycena floridula]|nr:hypothetical protein C8J56DRAFT_960191 [Mycena floridula]
MSQFSLEPQRPGIRRKSSAQNLLSSFKAPGSSSGLSSSTPTPSILTSTSALGQTPLLGAATPIATTPLAREWDSQSLHSDTVASSSSTLGQGTSVEYLRDLVQKRIITLNYVRDIHEGRCHWFHTILISKAELEREFNNVDMRKRTIRFSILGMSLSNLLDIQQPQDLLRGLIHTLQEYDQAKEDLDKPKMRPPKRLFNRAKFAKRMGGMDSGYADSESYLMVPQVPFPLDYHQTLLSLLDVVSEVYNKISKLLGPSPFPHSSQHMMGPLGLLAPHPGVSYLFSGDTSNPNPYSQGPSQHSNPNLNQPAFSSDSDLTNSSLWGIANPNNGGPGSFQYGGAASPPPAWTPGFGEMVLKIDSKFKKITSTLLKELDQFARNGIKDELASLDPLLRNINIQESGNKQYYDFDT